MPIEPRENPLELVREWMADARAAGMKYPNAASLATVDASGLPDVRAVLVKDIDERGFVFYTNLRSAKARELATNPKAALNLYWEIIDRQVRARGPVEPVTAAEANAYFATRPRISQLGAWASQQSEPLEHRSILEARVAELESRYAGRDVPRPPHWSGYRVLPSEVEFWREGPFRLHDRLLYSRTGTGWRTTVLNP